MTAYRHHLDELVGGVDTNIPSGTPLHIAVHKDIGMARELLKYTKQRGPIDEYYHNHKLIDPWLR